MRTATKAKEEFAENDATGNEEGTLVRRICAGDVTAFETVMRRYNRRLYRVARSILKDDAEAEDTVQEAYWKAYQAMKTFRAESRLSTWLTRIVINESLGRMRKAKRRMDVIEYAEAPTMDRIHSKVDYRADGDQRPEALVWRAEVRALIEEKLDTLPCAYRTVFVLRAVEEMSAVEVAAALEIPEATVRSRFFRARRLMREAMVDEIDGRAKEAFSFDGARCDRIVANVLARVESRCTK